MAEFSGGPVVVGVDGSPAGLVAARLAAREAVLRDCPLRVVHGFVWPLYQVPKYAELREDAQRVVQEAVAVASAVAPGVPVSGHVVDGEPGAVLREECRTAALAVLAPSDPGHHGAPSDSVVEHLAARASCPVMVAHRAQHTGGPVLAGVDGSADSTAAVRFAACEAAALETDLVAVHVGQGERAGDRLLADAAAEARRAAGLGKIEQRRISGEPGAAMVAQSTAAQLVVVGARGHFRSLLGEVSYALLRNAHCPVVIAHAAPRAPRGAEPSAD